MDHLQALSNEVNRSIKNMEPYQWHLAAVTYSLHLNLKIAWKTCFPSSQGNFWRNWHESWSLKGKLVGFLKRVYVYKLNSVFMGDSSVTTQVQSWSVCLKHSREIAIKLCSGLHWHKGTSMEQFCFRDSLGLNGFGLNKQLNRVKIMLCDTFCAVYNTISE